MRTFIFIGITGLFIACNTSKELSDNNVDEAATEETVEDAVMAIEESQEEPTSESEENPGKPQRPAFVRGEIGDVNARTDDYKIKSAKIEGDILYLTVTYSGGCASHTFKCIGDAAVAKSNPPRRIIKLIHDADNDSCEAKVTRDIEIDIIPFAASQAGPSEIILDLEGHKQILKFSH